MYYEEIKDWFNKIWFKVENIEKCLKFPFRIYFFLKYFIEYFLNSHMIVLDFL